MDTIADDLMDAVVARLRALPVVGKPEQRIRRDHRTDIALEDTPAVHVIDGDETPEGKSGCGRAVTLDFRVAIFVRADDGSDIAAPLKVKVMQALDGRTEATAYPHNAVLKEGRIARDQDIADNDSLRVDMYFTFKYSRADWSLSETTE